MPASLLIELCFQCGNPVSVGRKFCSRECKSKSQIKRIELTCSGCEKHFLLLSYLKRKNNYCSTECYWDSTRVKEKRICKICGNKFFAFGSQIRKGFGIYCSRECQHTEYPLKVEKFCKQCDKRVLVWPSKTNLIKFCSKKCKDDFERDYLDFVCKQCNKPFQLPRSDYNRGRGNFCSRKCYFRYNGPSSLELKMEKALNLCKVKYLREVKFKRFYVDFLLESPKVVVECDGEHWHMRPRNIERDKRKQELLESLGFKVLRFTGREINKYSEKKLGEVVLSRL